jgi:hypothetical protein
MTGDDVVVLADQDRVGKSECADAASNLRDLRVGVRASIPRRGNQPLDRSVLESQVIASLICSGSSSGFVAHFMFSFGRRATPHPEFRGNFSVLSSISYGVRTKKVFGISRRYPRCCH